MPRARFAIVRSPRAARVRSTSPLDIARICLIRPEAPLQLDNGSAVLLLGVNPQWRIHLLRGNVEDNLWLRPTFDTPEVNASPREGYILVKVKPTTPSQPLGVSLVFPEGKPHGPCQDGVVPTFSLSPGAVNYLGDLAYTFENQQLRYSYSIDTDAARAFLSAKYPSYVASLTTRPMIPLKVKGGGCNPIIKGVPILSPIHH